MKWVKAAGATMVTLALLLIWMLFDAAAELNRYAEDTCPYGRDSGTDNPDCD